MDLGELEKKTKEAGNYLLDASRGSRWCGAMRRGKASSELLDIASLDTL